MTTKVTAASASKVQPKGFRMPTQAELVKAYKSIVVAHMKDGTLKPMKNAPAGFAKAPSYNITDPRMLGSSQTVYVIKNELYLKSQVVAPNAKPHWAKVGPAPMF